MMRIGVEEGLTNVTEALQQKGYEVVSLSNATDLDECDCCVVTGMDSNIMGMQTTTTKVPVIEASGLSAEEVCKEVENKLH
ncbi:YkuS family protein [Siminovitchia sp. FSL W7-1587]|uniref:YkuS family protein n=1 Tax=Siminovitchia sp. FSL W7-1587 TaxID=2954699 RepID=UPI0030D4C87A